MKRLILSLLIVLCGTLSVKALSYPDARREAWFLTDKMAYELNLTPEQCDVVYEINLDYFLSIRRARDCRGPYWRYRNEDLRYVLFRWQYELYEMLDYFYRPIRWRRSSWYYPVCHYYHRDYYFFERPIIYVNYHGHGWRNRGSGSYYNPYRNRTFRNSVGLRDHYNGRESSRTYRFDKNQPVYTPRVQRDDADRKGRDRLRSDADRRIAGHGGNVEHRQSSDNRIDAIHRGERPSHEYHYKSQQERIPVNRDRDRKDDRTLRTRDHDTPRPSREIGKNKEERIDRGVRREQPRRTHDNPSRKEGERKSRDREFGR